MDLGSLLSKIQGSLDEKKCHTIGAYITQLKVSKEEVPHLHTLISYLAVKLGKCSEQEIPLCLDIIQKCLESGKSQDFVNFQGSTEKRCILGSITEKCIQKGLFDKALWFSERRYEDLCVAKTLLSKQKYDVQKTYISTHAIRLWNVAIQIHQKSIKPNVMLVLQLRVLALKLLSMVTSNIPALTGKFRTTLEQLHTLKIDDSQKGRNIVGTNIDSMTGIIWSLLSELVSNIRETSEVSWDLKVESCIDLYVHYFKFLWVFSRNKGAEEGFSSLGKLIDSERVSAKDEMSNRLLDVCICIFDLLKSMIDFKTENSARAKNMIYKSCLSKKLKTCNSSVFGIVAVDAPATNTRLLSSLATTCSLCAYCLSHTRENCKPEMKSILSKELREIYQLHSELTDMEMRMWIDKGVDSLEPLEKKRLEAVCLESITVKCSFIDLLVKKICQIEGVKKELVAGIMKQCMTEMSREKKRILQGINDCRLKLPKRMCLELGNLCHRAGRACGSYGWHTEAKEFLLIGRDLFVEFNKTASDSEQQNYLSPSKFWQKGFEPLIESLKRCSLHEEAMENILQGTCVAHKSLASAAKCWVKIKYDLCLRNEGSTLITRTMHEQAIKMDVGHLCPSELILLQAEQMAFRNFRGQLPKPHMIVVEKLLTQETDDIHKASNLIEKARLTWTVREGQGQSAQEASGFCNDAISLLKRCQEESGLSTQLLDLLASAHLTLYITQSVDPIKFQDISLTKAKKRKQAMEQKSVLTNIDTLEDTESFEEECISISEEEISLENAFHALSLWEKITDDGIEKLEDSNQTISLLLVIASIFQLAHRVDHQIRALKMAIHISKATQDHTKYLTSCTSLIEAVNKVKQPSCSIQLIKTVETWMKNCKLDHLKQSVNYALYLCSKSEALYLLCKLQESYKVMLEVMEVKKKVCGSTKTKENMMLESAICLLLCRFRTLPPSVWQAPEQTIVNPFETTETALEIAMRGARAISSVVSFSLGSWVIMEYKPENNQKAPDNVLQKWQLLNQLLPALLVAGEHFSRVGDPREAKCYLGQGLSIAQGFNLPHWCAIFHLEKAKLENMMSSFNDVQALLHRVKYVLNADTPASAQRADSSREEEEEPMNDSDNFLSTKDLEVEENGTNSDDMFNSPSSPINRKDHTPFVPTDWGHPIECVCKYCSDQVLQMCIIKKFIRNAESHIYQNATCRAEKTLTLVLENFDHLTNKAQYHINKMISTTGVLDMKKIKFVPSIFQDLLLEICHYLVSIAVSDTNKRSLNEWGTKCRELIDTSLYPWMIDYQVTEAHLLYLESVFMDKPDDEATDAALDHAIDKLCSDISKIKLKNADTRNFKTPYIGRGNVKKAQSESDLSTIDNDLMNTISCIKKADSAFDISNTADVESITDKISSEVPEPMDTTPIIDPKTGTGKTRNRQNNVSAPARRSGTRERSSVKSLSSLSTPSLDSPAPATLVTPRRTSGRTMKTPTSVSSSRRAMLDALLDSDDDSAPTTQSRAKRTSKRNSNIMSSKAKPSTNRGRMRKLCHSSPTENSAKLAPDKPTRLPVPVLGSMSNDNRLSSGESQEINKGKKQTKTRNARSLIPSVYDFDSEKESNTSKAPTKAKQTTKTLTRPRRGRPKKSETESARSDKPEESDNVDVFAFPDMDDEDTLPGNPAARSARNRRKTRTTKKTENAEIGRLSPKGTKNDADNISDLEQVEEDDYDDPLLVNQDEVDPPVRPSPSDDISLPLLDRVNKDSDDIGIETARNASDSDDSCSAQAAIQRKLMMKKRRRSGGRGIYNAAAENKENANPRPPTELTRSERSKHPIDIWCDDSSLLGVCVRTKLSKAYELLRHYPPTPIYRKVCLAMARMYLAEESVMQAAFFLSEAQNATFRHTALLNLSKKIRKIDEGKGSGNESLRKRLVGARKALHFGGNLSDFKTTLDSIVKEWTVCHLTVVEGVRTVSPVLLITRYSKGKDPLIIKLPGYSKDQGQKLIKEFTSIMNVNTDTMSLSDKENWWNERIQLDKRLKELLSDIDNQWLGCWKGLLLGSNSNIDAGAKVDDIVKRLCAKLQVNSTRESHILQILIESCHLLSERELFQGVQTFCDTKDVVQLQEIVSLIRCSAKPLCIQNETRNPLILVIDKAVQHIPWESLPVVRDQQITRVPSLQYLHAQVRMSASDPSSVLVNGIDLSKVFYVLNPGKDLSSTEQQFKGWFEKEKGWQGITGVAPGYSHLTQALTESDLYIYCGHGSGSKFVSSTFLQVMNCRAAALIMGCSSGKLVANGQLEPVGTMLSYFLGGCPCIIANLWDVTDKDIDRFMAHLLKSWLASQNNESALSQFYKSRKSCRLTHLVGAAPVVYGLPIKLQKRIS